MSWGGLWRYFYPGWLKRDAGTSTSAGVKGGAGDSVATDSAPRSRQATAEWCANNTGIGFYSPIVKPAAGYTWRQDAEGPLWRIYRVR